MHQSASSVPQASTLSYWAHRRQKCAFHVLQIGRRRFLAAVEKMPALTSVVQGHLARTVVHATCVYMENSRAFLARARAHLVLKIQIQHIRAQPEPTASAKLVTLGQMVAPARRVNLVNSRHL